jgi:hypothetical protein
MRVLMRTYDLPLLIAHLCIMLEKSLDVISKSVWVGITPNLSAPFKMTKGTKLTLAQVW